MSEQFERLTAALADRYAVEHELGSGGMATVYLAEDQKHHRPVAIKVLRPELGAAVGAERFLREIEVAAKLQHPHILALHDSGEAAGLLYYVMPYVEGESVRERLDRETHLPVEDALQIAREVADAVQYAHQNDVVHRDIKPENILLSGGHAIVSDFGIARAVTVAGDERLTGTGLAIGTPTYMSPEQATGTSRVDGRSDVYSLGCVLYEMLAGEPPFTGPTVESVIARRLTDSAPELRTIRETVPASVERAVAKALARLPADRFGDAAQFAEALTTPVEEAALPEPAAAPVIASLATLLRRRSVANWQLATVVTLLVFAAAVAVWGWSRSPPASPTARFTVAVPSTQPLVSAVGTTIALSPDGSQLVYVGEGPQLYLRSMDQLRATAIPGTEGAYNPFFSPDGQWVGFVAEGILKKVNLAGGPPVTILETTGLIGGVSWGPPDVILFDTPSAAGLSVMAAGGGEPRVLTTPLSEASEVAHVTPRMLPDGEAALITIAHGATVEKAEIGVVSLETGQVTPLELQGIDARYAHSGHVIFVRADGALLAAPFDLRRRTVAGQAFPVVEGVRIKSGAVAEYTISRNGSLVYLPATAAERTLVMVDREGMSRLVTAERRSFYAPRFSPDGNQVAVTVFEEGTRDIWLYSLEGGAPSRLTFEGDNLYPIWAPDGTHIAFTSTRGGSLDLYRRPADGSGAAEVLIGGDPEQYMGSLSPDGRWAVFTQVTPGYGRDIWAVTLDGNRTARQIVATPFEDRSPALSPDGRWLAYSSNESGKQEIYVVAFPDLRGKWQVSTSGGTEPLWARDGRRLFYRSGNRMMAAAVETDPVFALRSHAVLLDGAYVPNEFHSNYDAHPDGDRFVMVESGETSTQLVVVLNWFEEVRRGGS